MDALAHRPFHIHTSRATAEPTVLRCHETVSGRALNQRLKAMTSDAERVLLALELQHARLEKLTNGQVAALVKVPVAYVSTARHASANQRRELAGGRVSISQLHHKYREPISDDEVERRVAAIGLERVLNALDRLTQPMAEAAE